MLTPKEALCLAETGSVPEPNTGCWLWLGYTTAGYAVAPRLRKNGRQFNFRLTRLILGLTDPKVFACHKCDQPSCVNPAHLFAGTQLDNMRDGATKGRVNRGTANGMARLSPDTVKAIYAAEGTRRAIAKTFGVAQSQVTRIKLGQRWAHVTSAR